MSEAAGTAVIVALAALALAGIVMAVRPRRRVLGLFIAVVALLALPAFILSEFAAHYTE